MLFNYFLLLRGNGPNIILNLTVHWGIGNVNTVERTVQQVTENCSCPVKFSQHQAWCWNRFDLLEGRFPPANQWSELRIQESYFAVFGNCSYYHSVVLRLNALYQTPEPVPFFFGLYFWRYGNLIWKWYQNEISASKRYLTCQPGALGWNGFFSNLNKYFLTSF